MPARSRLLAPCLAVLLGATLASCSEDPEVTGADPAALPEDLCAALAEEVPSDLGLDGGSPSHAVDDELVRAGCRWSGEGDTDLVVEVVSYALPDADDTTPVDRALDGACRTLAGTPDVEQLVEQAGGCSGAGRPGSPVSSPTGRRCTCSSPRRRRHPSSWLLGWRR